MFTFHLIVTSEMVCLIFGKVIMTRQLVVENIWLVIIVYKFDVTLISSMIWWKPSGIYYSLSHELPWIFQTLSRARTSPAVHLFSEHWIPNKKMWLTQFSDLNPNHPSGASYHLIGGFLTRCQRCCYTASSAISPSRWFPLLWLRWSPYTTQIIWYAGFKQ